MNIKNILIVDDHAAMRTGLRVLLNEFYAGLSIFECGDDKCLLSHFKNQAIDLLVMDIQMPNLDTIGMVEFISIKYPSTYILVFSMLPERIYGRRLLKAGAMGYLPKETSIEEMKHAFDTVLKSKKYLSQNLIEILSSDTVNKNITDPFSQLSHREFEILNYLLLGISINLIAQTLGIKPSTVGTYKGRIFEKLQVRTIFELKDLATLHNFKDQYMQLR